MNAFRSSLNKLIILRIVLIRKYISIECIQILLFTKQELEVTKNRFSGIVLLDVSQRFSLIGTMSQFTYFLTGKKKYSLFY